MAVRIRLTRVGATKQPTYRQSIVTLLAHLHIEQQRFLNFALESGIQMDLL